MAVFVLIMVWRFFFSFPLSSQFLEMCFLPTFPALSRSPPVLSPRSACFLTPRVLVPPANHTRLVCRAGLCPPGPSISMSYIWPCPSGGLLVPFGFPKALGTPTAGTGEGLPIAAEQTPRLARNSETASCNGDA